MRAVLKAKKMLFVCVDIQERLLELMAHKESVVKNANILLSSTQILQAPLLITEQYPKGLGKTHSAINLPENAPILEKTSFGIFGDEDIKIISLKANVKLWSFLVLKVIFVCFKAL